MMPKVKRNQIDLTKLSQEEIDILNIVVKKDDSIRSTRPNIEDALTGDAAYVWRMVVFFVSPVPAHHCMPVTADFYLQEPDLEKRKALIKELDKLVDIIVDAVDKKDWAGVRRWSSVLGGGGSR